MFEHAMSLVVRSRYSYVNRRCPFSVSAGSGEAPTACKTTGLPRVQRQRGNGVYETSVKIHHPCKRRAAVSMGQIPPNTTSQNLHCSFNTTTTVSKNFTTTYRLSNPPSFSDYLLLDGVGKRRCGGVWAAGKVGCVGWVWWG